jgi:hypothetical protein
LRALPADKLGGVPLMKEIDVFSSYIFDCVPSQAAYPGRWIPELTHFIDLGGRKTPSFDSNVFDKTNLAIQEPPFQRM